MVRGSKAALRAKLLPADLSIPRSRAAVDVAPDAKRGRLADATPPPAPITRLDPAKSEATVLSIPQALDGVATLDRLAGWYARDVAEVDAEQAARLRRRTRETALEVDLVRLGLRDLDARISRLERRREAERHGVDLVPEISAPPLERPQ